MFALQVCVLCMSTVWCGVSYVVCVYVMCDVICVCSVCAVCVHVVETVLSKRH